MISEKFVLKELQNIMDQIKEARFDDDVVREKYWQEYWEHAKYFTEMIMPKVVNVFKWHVTLEDM